MFQKGDKNCQKVFFWSINHKNGQKSHNNGEKIEKVFQKSHKNGQKVFFFGQKSHKNCQKVFFGQ